MERLTIYILCHNRPDFARQTIASVRAQTSHNYELVVSDNSSNDEVEHMVRNEFPDVRYLRRQPMLAPHAHFNRCIGEAQREYFCLFHDDDLMAPDFVETMQQCVRKYPGAVAIGCNAVIENAGKLEARYSFRSYRSFEVIDSARELAARYFSRAQSGFAPFPCYVYNRRMVGATRLAVDGGKYADVAWLLDLAGSGPIVWINRPLMTYRMHGGNDGMVESARDRLRLLAYLKRKRIQFGEGILSDYRNSFIYKPIERKGTGASAARRRIASAFLKRHRCRRYVRPDTYRALARRTLIKWMAE